MRSSSILISTKIKLAFVSMFLIVGALGGIASERIGALNAQSVQIRDNWLPSVGHISDLISIVKQARTDESSLFVVDPSSEPQKRVEYEQKFKEQIAAADKLRTEYEKTLMTVGTDDEKLMKSFDEGWADYKTQSAKVVDLFKVNDEKGARELFESSDTEAYSRAIESVEQDSDFNIAEGKKAANTGEEIYKITHTIMVYSIVVAAVLCITLGFVLIRSTSKPVSAMTDVMTRLSQHDLTVEVFGLTRGDEIGAMAKSVEVFKKSMIETDRLRAEQEEAKKRGEQEKREMMNKLANDFESSVQGVIATVAAASTELYQTAEGMKQTMGETAEQSSSVATASTQTSSSVQSVSAALEEMSASVREIASQISKSSVLVNETVVRTQQAGTTVQALSEAVAQISSFAELINNISGQINLLALNATIESARAGEAGKGFAVVASEVKTLATQTGKATEEITKQIENVRKASTEVARVLDDIHKAIDDVNQYSSGIASAVEEQSAATGEIASNMQTAAQGVREITTNIGQVTKGVSTADQQAGEVLGASQMLSKQSELLNTQVMLFLSGIRS